MNRTPWSAAGLALVLITGLAACGNDRAGDNVKVRQTQLPGHFSAGGGTSGEVMARSKQAADAPPPAGTPGIPQGSGGNVGGAALGGAVEKDTAVGGTGQKTPEQAREGSLPQTAPSVSTPPADAPRAANEPGAASAPASR